MDDEDDNKLDSRCDVNLKSQQQVEEADDGDCCPQETHWEEECAEEREPCLCGGRGRTECECVEALRRVVAGNVMWPRRQPLTYYAKVQVTA